MENNEKIAEILKTLKLDVLKERIEQTNQSNSHFLRLYKELGEKYAGNIVAVSATGKIAHIPFTRDISEAKEHFKRLEEQVGRDNMRTATISYIPKPGQILLL